MSNICEICAENINNSTENYKMRNNICGFTACKSKRKYILQSYTDPHCMACKHPYDDEFISENLNQSFKEEYKEHRKIQLYNLEVSQIPSTMTLASNEQQARNKDKDLNNIRDKISKLRREIYKYEREYNSVRREIDVLRNSKAQEKYKFTMRCSKENCKGFLSTAYKCGLCNNYTCPTCLQYIGPDKNSEHTCDADMVKTAELIKIAQSHVLVVENVFKNRWV